MSFLMEQAGGQAFTGTGRVCTEKFFCCWACMNFVALIAKALSLSNILKI
jgi:hypothetical protein